MPRAARAANAVYVVVDVSREVIIDYVHHLWRGVGVQGYRGAGAGAGGGGRGAGRAPEAAPDRCGEDGVWRGWEAPRLGEERSETDDQSATRTAFPRVGVIMKGNPIHHEILLAPV